MLLSIEELISIGKDREREYLRKLHRLKSMGSDGIYPQVQRELDYVIARPLFLGGYGD